MSSKITALGAATSLATTDIMPAVTDPAGSPVTKKITFANIIASIINVLTGLHVGNVANINVIGGIPVVHRITCTTLTGDVDVTLTHKTRIIDAHCIATAAGGAGDTVTVKNGATAITNAMDLNVGDKAIVRAGEIDDAAWDIAAGGTLRITGASGVNAEVLVRGLRVA